MTKEQKERFDNLYSFSSNILEDDIENEKDNEKEKKKKIKEREKRIKQNNKIKNEQFDFDTEMVIGMTNKNNKRNVIEKQQKMTKKQAQIQRKKKKIKRIIKLITLLLIIICGIVFALVSPIFNVKEIRVINNEQISTETIISLSQLQLGQNLFKYNRNKVEKEIKTNSYIEDVDVKRKIPNRIEITIKERHKNFNLQFLNSYAYINNQGYILEISEQKLDLPVIQGFSTQEEQIVEGNRLNEQDLERLEVVIQIMNICKNYEIDSKVTTIDISNEENFVIYMEEEKKTIYLGDETNLNDKMIFIPKTLEETKEKEGYIYMDKDTINKYRARFREKV